MRAERFIEIIGTDYFAGVPDSLLRPLCDCIMDRYGTDPRHHIIAANEGNAVALAAGYYLATGKAAAVYMQNSGEGNIVNPSASLLNEKVYGIPVMFIVGWRGEPGNYDEPQHIYQGEITIPLLESLEIESVIIDKETTEDDLKRIMSRFGKLLMAGRDVAFIVRKGAFTYQNKREYSNHYVLKREEIIRMVTDFSGKDPIVSTTGKASRELFEIREQSGCVHGMDFLTVGSMGHCSSIALGIALQKFDKRVWCIDGDGSVLMHLGALPVIANAHPKNLIHIVIHNGAYETVGGQPTALAGISVAKLAAGCGYPFTNKACNREELGKALSEVAARRDLSLIEVMCAIGAREDLGRPLVSARKIKDIFMKKL